MIDNFNTYVNKEIVETVKNFKRLNVGVLFSNSTSEPFLQYATSATNCIVDTTLTALTGFSFTANNYDLYLFDGEGSSIANTASANLLFNLGYNLFTISNDSALGMNIITGVRSNSGYWTAIANTSSSAVTELTTGLTGFSQFPADTDTGNTITSVTASVTALFYHNDGSNNPMILYRKNPINNAVWIHSQAQDLQLKSPQLVKNIFNYFQNYNGLLSTTAMTVATSSSSYTTYSTTSSLSSVSAVNVWSYFNNKFYNNSLPTSGYVKFISLTNPQTQTKIKPASTQLTFDGYTFNDYKLYDPFVPYNYGVMYYNSDTALTAGHVFYEYGLFIFTNTGLGLTSTTATQVLYTSVQENQYLSVNVPVYMGKYTSSKLFNNSNTSLTALNSVYTRLFLMDGNFTTLAGYSLTATELNKTNKYYQLKVSN